MKRVVTGHTQEGTSIFVATGDPPHGISYDDGSQMYYCWETRGIHTLGQAQIDPTASMTTFMPAPGGTTFVITTLPGYSQSNMHTTASIDYIVIISGQLWLILDSGQEVLLAPGDTIVQNGTNHAWQNRYPEPCVLAAVMLGIDQTGHPSS